MTKLLIPGYAVLCRVNVPQNGATCGSYRCALAVPAPSEESARDRARAFLTEGDVEVEDLRPLLPEEAAHLVSIRLMGGKIPLQDPTEGEA